MAADDPKVTPLRKPRPCPECGKPSQRATFPFCSERCKNIDLNRWLTGSYAIPGPPADEDGVEGGPDVNNDGEDDSRG